MRGMQYMCTCVYGYYSLLWQQCNVTQMLSSIYLIDFKRTPKIYFKDKLYKLNLIELSQVQICNTLLMLTVQSLWYEEVTVMD